MFVRLLKLLKLRCLFTLSTYKKIVHLVGFIIRLYHDARSPERQKKHVLVPVSADLFGVLPFQKYQFFTIIYLQLKGKMNRGTVREIQMTDSIRKLLLRYAYSVAWFRSVSDSILIFYSNLPSTSCTLFLYLLHSTTCFGYISWPS